jgi:hypothetical protein
MHTTDRQDKMVKGSQMEKFLKKNVLMEGTGTVV